MNFNPNDPKWTAYAFDELDANERAAIEAELGTHPAAQQFVNELRRTGELLKNALLHEPAVTLTADQRAKLTAAADQQPAANAATVALPSPLPVARHRRRWIAVLGAVAASVAIVALVWPAIQSAREAGTRVAKTEIQRETEKVSSGRTDAPEELLEERADGERFVNSNRTREIPYVVTSPQGAPANDPAGASSSKPMSYTIQKPLHESKTDSPIIVMDEEQSSTRRYKANLDLSTKEGRFSGYGAGVDGIRNAIPAAGFEPQPVAEESRPITYPNKEEWDRLTYQRAAIDRGEGKPQQGRERNVAGKPATLHRIEQLRGEIYKRSSVPTPSVGDFAAAQSPIPLPGKEAEVTRLESEIRDLQREGLVDSNTEAYDLPPENAFEPVANNPLSTFSIDVDTASYANVRRYLMQTNQLPPPAAVRIEEMLNYFRYDYPQPEGDVPFSVTTEVATCPWNADHRLVRVGLKGKEIAKEKRPVSNLVFLLDVSGSMQPANKLPLVREAMKLLVRELSENDRVAIVVYAGASGMVLDSTTADQKDLIVAAIDNLQAGGSTNGAGGIQLAYDVATQNFIKGGTNRVILATDGDFNVGITDRGELIKLITDRAKSGVFLTTLGFGMGNLKDATLEQLADKGNGNYAYVDTLSEARKVFVEELTGTLVTIAKDVKVQIEFNPAEVESYRLIGYENRRLAAEDFNDDKKDAGEIGAGHTVTALYELVPGKARDTAGQASSGTQVGQQPGVDPLRYQKPTAPKVELTDAAKAGELFTLKLRYKQPDGDTSKLIEHPVKDSGKAYREASGDFKFAASVAAFGMTLRHSQHRGTITLDGIKELALEGRSFDPSGYRSEFFTLIDRAAALGAK